MLILGLSAFYHDSAAALIEDGRIIAAAQEERFTRKKADANFPRNALAYCLQEANTKLEHIDHVVFYDKPFLKFERLLETYIAFAPKGFTSFRMAVPLWLREKLFLKSLIVDELKEIAPECDWTKKLSFSEHHLSHAASAFYPSPFENAAVLTLDGVGEWATTTFGIGSGSSLSIHKEIHFPHSLGLLYAAMTYYTGFKVNSGEYKVMGLAPYGEPKYAQLILDHLIDLKGDGSFRLNLDYFDYCTGLTMTNKRFDALFGGQPRKPETLLTQRDMDLASSVQHVIEEAILRMTRSLAKETGLESLCLAGGVALNCVANGKILRDGAFKKIWVQPASGDAGGAIGAALASYHLQFGQKRSTRSAQDTMSGSYLGPSFSQDEIERRLNVIGAKFKALTSDDMIDLTARAIADGKAIGWFQGRMEFGPRALGSRSILGDPRSPAMQKILNVKIKYRESFRPFAPSILREHISDWFEIDCDSPYMLIVAQVAEKHRIAMTKEQSNLFGLDRLNVPRSTIPAVTHIDYSARIQTVHEETNPIYYSLIKRFYELTGVPLIINTSFNVRSEPIVCTPEDAFRCFMGTDIDLLVIGNSIVEKDFQELSLRKKYHDDFELD